MTKQDKPFHEPPRRWMRFLRWFCADRFWSEIEGDLCEWFNEEVDEKGMKAARRSFALQVPAYLRLYFLRRDRFSFNLNYRAMLRSYLKVAFRNSLKHKWYSLLNSLGLTAGFAAFILIAVYVYHETHYESFHVKAERIYRPTYRYQSGSGFSVQWARIPVDYINELPNEMPEIEKLIRFQNQERKYVRVGKEKFKPDHVYVTDREVFDVFDFHLLTGDPHTALEKPNSVVLTASLAQKYFGSKDVIGREIYITGDWTPEETLYQVTGLMRDLPSNTHLPVEMLLSFADESQRSGWAYIYTLLKPGASISKVEAKIPEFIAKHADEEQSGSVDFQFQPMEDIHLHSNLAREIVPNGNLLYVRVLCAVAFFILAIALVNFINLSSAMSLSRSREIGVRKILGARKSHNMLYAFTESIGFSLLAVLLAVAMASFIFPYLEEFTGMTFTMDIFSFAGLVLMLAIVSGLLAGIYPAVILNSLNLQLIVKQSNKLNFGGRGFGVKRFLVTLQFCASLILIAGTLVGYRQLKYLHEKSLGLKKEQILALADVPDAVTAKYRVFKERIKPLAGVQGVAACMQVPSEEIRDSGPVLVRGVNDDPERAPVIDVQIIDADYIDMMEIELLAGEVPSHEFVLKPVPEFTDELTPQQYLYDQPRSYLVNESAMQQLGWTSPHEALGREISWSIGNFKLAAGEIAGVVKDFHRESLKNEVDPLLMLFEPIWLRTFLIEVETDDLEPTVQKVRAVWDELFPQYPFEYHFLDDLFDNLYKSERIQIQLLGIFSCLSIFIASLGLISLVAFSLRTRVKEIAIRKVLGADLPSLIGLIGREYMWMTVISGLFALPVIYFWGQKWLDSFAYRIDLSPLTFISALIGLGAVLLLIISLQTYWSTRINPVENLKEE